MTVKSLSVEAGALSVAVVVLLVLVSVTYCGEVMWSHSSVPKLRDVGDTVTIDVAPVPLAEKVPAWFDPPPLLLAVKLMVLG